ncbi:recombinase family protein [Lachnotalea glycerini]|uniref:Recombinase family protein n=1 Tax=Lachnotalea glycerini TaxID=1763509 RepID=A0A371JBM7_9FIRM|nr:recombinase family protein [Lachnotalea glycerini]RDY30154.1 recombinase family protein [Lachnotalea glycerini]
MIGIYVRQSIEKRDSLSIDSQIEKCVNLCKLNGWNDYIIYKDPGYSGKDLNRPDFKRLVKDVENGKLEYVVCYRLDRISRSMRDFVNLIADFDECGTRFVSVTEAIDTSTSAGRVLMTVIIAMAQMERENIIERVTDNYYFRCNMGYWGGGVAPYGYKLKRIVEGGKAHTVLDIDEKEASIVRQFFDWYLEPEGSVRSILTKTIEAGIKTRNGSLWTSRVVSDLLWKPLYAPNNMDIYNFFKTLNAHFVNSPEEFDGTAAVNLYGKLDKKASKHKRCRSVKDQYFIVSKHQPLIDSDTWIKVQRKKGFVMQTPPRKGTSQNSIFTGLIRCKECGSNVSIMKDGKGYNYYVCSSRKNRGKGSCSLPLISQKKFDPAILQDLKVHFQDEKVLEKIKDSSTPSYSSEYLIKMNTHKMELAAIDKEIENLVAAVASGNDVVSKYLNEKMNELDQKKSSINKLIQTLEIKEYAQNNHFVDFKSIENLEEQLENGTFAEQKNIAQNLIKNIYVNAQKEIEVEYYL